MRTKYKNQIEYVKSKGAINGASISNWCFDRIWISFKNFKCFGSDAATIGVFLKTAYSRKNSFTRLVPCCFEKRSTKAGLYAKSVNGDAFSDEIKKKR
jgi:enoyl-[acyl-carrier protein] reductase/trans-2-enoyl-CoA reductase (NAD+)